MLVGSKLSMDFHDSVIPQKIDQQDASPSFTEVHCGLGINLATCAQHGSHYPERVGPIISPLLGALRTSVRGGCAFYSRNHRYGA
jgi:hypothetical protein